MALVRKAAILVVDDEAAVRFAIARALEAQGHQVTAAADGREALERLRGATFELVICDIAMPHLDGIELCEIVRREPRTSSIPFLFLSAYQDIETRLKGLSAGADDFLGKPFSLNEMTYRVHRLLTNRSLPLVDERLEVNPNHLSQASLEQCLHLVCSQALSGQLSVILPDGAVGQVDFEEGKARRVRLESAAGETLTEECQALETILGSPCLAFTFSGQQTLDNAVLMSQITRIVEVEAGR